MSSLAPTPSLGLPALAGLRMHHFSIAVPDMAAALVFWQDIFGFSLLFRHYVDGLQGTVAFVERDGLRIELWSLDKAAGVPTERTLPNTDLLTCGTKHIAFYVPDLQAVLEGLSAKGVRIVSVQRSLGQPMVEEDDPLSQEGREPPVAAFISDPGGSLIELISVA